MASVTRARRVPLGLSIIIAIALVLAFFLAVQWITHLVWSLVRLALIFLAFLAIARVGLYLLRNGGSRPS